MTVYVLSIKFRMKKVISSVVVCTLFAGTLLQAHAATFPDVPESNYSFPAVEYFASLGVLSGYKDNNTGIFYFKPEQKVNRAEAVKMLLAGSTQKYTIQTGLTSNIFPDVAKDAWYAPYVAVAVSNTIVKGDDTTGRFDPGRTVNKAELMKMVVLANKVDISGKLTGVEQEVASDVPSTVWHYNYMRFGKEYGIIFPDRMGNMNPGKELSRGEVSEIMFNMHKVIKGGKTQEYLSRTEAKIFSSITKLNLQDYKGASEDMKKATSYVQTALSQSPNEMIVKEAVNITKSFSLAIDAYSVWKVDGKLNEAKNKAREARKGVSDIIALTELKKTLETIVDTLDKAS